MGNSENNLKILEGFCGFDSHLEEISKPCKNPSDDEEYLELHKKIHKEVACQREKQNRKLAEAPDIYYGNN